MKRNIVYLSSMLLFISLCTSKAKAQENAPADGAATGLSGNAAAASRFENTLVNYYTGMPSVSIPLFNYSDPNGLDLSITLDYSTGGIGVNESPSTAGLGWVVNAGGSIVRTVRGMPDDDRSNGYMYAPAVPLDFREHGSEYYHDSLDAQQDIYQYNINGRAGKFFIGKDKQIVTVPLSKLRIGYTTYPSDSSIVSFYIITEQGVKYTFNEPEWAVSTYHNFDCGYNADRYKTAWDLSSIISSFGTDTINFSYKSTTQSGEIETGRTAYILSGENSIDKYLVSTASQTRTSNKISTISFPDKKIVTFVYDPQIKYDDSDNALNSIHIRDSVFRYGYKFEWDNVHRSFLTGLRSYTNAYLMPGYKFFYNTPYFPAFNGDADTLGNKRDHWGFYNAAAHDTNQIPSVQGLFTGANREPSAAALASTLSSITDPAGGKTYYSFENNDVYRTYYVQPQYKRLDCKASEETTMHFRHLSSSTDSFTLSPSTFYLPDYSQVSDQADMIWSITNADSTVIYATDTISLFSLFFAHTSISYPVDAIPNGDYVFKTKLTPGTIIGGGPLFIDLRWNNQISFELDKIKVGGLRIRQVAHFDPVTGRTDTISTYKYELPNGRSSGFLGVSPVYNHPYLEIRTDLSGFHDYPYDVISAEPVNNQDYTQGSPVGYSRVEVIKGSPTHNLGKEVYEYSSLQDAGLNVHAQIFPYAPYTQQDWLLGLNKKTSVYDNAGRLMQETVNTYNMISKTYNDSACRSLKLGLTSTFYDGSNRIESYTGAYYFPESGRADLATTTQTFYHTDNSVQVKTQQVEYDSNYNAVKITGGYDQSRGLSLERRMYYPYNYTIGGTIGKLRDSSMYMLVSTEDWITGDSTPRMIAAAVTDFQQLPNGCIKPAALYALRSKAPLSQTTIGVFDPSTLIRDSAWIKKQQEFVSYDSIGNCLEIKNAVTGQSNAVIMDYFNRYAVAKIANAKITDVAYTSFESDGTGNWSVPSALRNATAITGKKSYDLSSGSITKSGLDTGMTYIISYWKANAATVSISGASNTVLAAEQNGWKLYTQTLGSASGVTVSGSGLIDELRLYPKNANMATSTYEPLIGITTACDANNSINYYEYDSANRIKVLRDKDLNVIKKYEYADSLVSRDLSTPGKVIHRESYWDAGTSTMQVECVYYWLYLDGIMSDAIIDPDPGNCPAPNIWLLPGD